jgi:ribonuclease M5
MNPSKQEKISIQEIIVVEGKDDIAAVKAAVDAEVLEVNGFSVKKQKIMERLQSAYEKKELLC